ncbi:hypothetical protein COV94_01615, partial [Candidatus Woesearchaeota archaeon CG11_big_fil_rev_8_21_14_0_20_57_5]
GTISISILANDSSNQANALNDSITITQAAPWFSDNRTNTTSPRHNSTIQINITINSQSHGNFSFAWNLTGTWQNISNGSYAAGQQISLNLSLTNATGNSIGYRWYANDTYGNSNDSDQQVLNLLDQPGGGSCQVTLNASYDGHIQYDQVSAYNRSDAGPLLYVESYQDFDTRAFLEFNISSIPDSETIQRVNLSFNVTAPLGTAESNCRVYPMSARPSDTTSNTTLWDDAGNNTPYNTSDACDSVGIKTVDLGNASADLQTLLGQDWFATGMYVFVASEEAVRIGASEGPYAPRLTITYSCGV